MIRKIGLNVKNIIITTNCTLCTVPLLSIVIATGRFAGSAEQDRGVAITQILSIDWPCTGLSCEK
jgi:hypothetical protein